MPSGLRSRVHRKHCRQSHAVVLVNLKTAGRETRAAKRVMARCSSGHLTGASNIMARQAKIMITKARAEESLRTVSNLVSLRRVAHGSKCERVMLTGQLARHGRPGGDQALRRHMRRTGPQGRSVSRDAEQRAAPCAGRSLRSASQDGWAPIDAHQEDWPQARADSEGHRGGSEDRGARLERPLVGRGARGPGALQLPRLWRRAVEDREEQGRSLQVPHGSLVHRLVVWPNRARRSKRRSGSR